MATPSDIISGREFLSLLMKPGPAGDPVAERGSPGDVPLAVAAATERPARNRGLHKFRHFFYEQQTAGDDEDETILPIEALFADGNPTERTERAGTRPYGRSAARNLKLPMTATTTTRTTGSSSSTMAAPSTTVSEPESEVTTEWVATTTEVKSLEPEEGKEPEPAHNSNSHRSELSVEEVAPMVASKPDAPEAKAEVTEQEQQQEPGKKGGQRTERARTERKQDTNGSLQTVVYHEKQETAGVAPPQKALSYRFIADGAGSVGHSFSQPARYYSEPAQYYSEPARIYSEPARIYGEPEKVYSEPARVYSQPARVYSEPAKVYSEPARVYSEPAKVYSQPSSYWQTAYEPAGTTEPPVPTDPPSTTSTSTTSTTSTTTTTTTTQPASDADRQHHRQRLVFNELDKIPYDQLNAPVDGEAAVTLHNAIGKFVPKQQAGAPVPVAQQPVLAPPVTASGDDGDSKIGYVVEGRNYRKYRVEEKTPDGFIVGEYGVLSHNDGNLRGVRYTADSDINPRLIYDALLKFLSL
uniref:Uncharacterized protein n=2 Tax=Anopheles albimanus TaxID=7167 RepID=A0A182FIR5_ANOAL